MRRSFGGYVGVRRRIAIAEFLEIEDQPRPSVRNEPPVLSID
jgi:hypothetical protein